MLNSIWASRLQGKPDGKVTEKIQPRNAQTQSGKASQIECVQSIDKNWRGKGAGQYQKCVDDDGMKFGVLQYIHKSVSRIITAATLLILAIFLFNGPAFAQLSIPQGWTKTSDDNGITLTSSTGQDEINIIVLGDQPGVDLVQLARAFIGKLQKFGCGNGASDSVDEIADRKAIRIATEQGGVQCSVIIGRSKGTLLMMANIGRTPGVDASLTLLGMARTIFENSPVPPPQRIAATAPPPVASGLPIGHSVVSAGTRGVWVAIVTKTVYDPVTAIRMEMGLDYLILTPGGYFMAELPKNAGFTDAAAKAMMQSSPKYAGRFVVSGQNLILKYASGETKTAIGSGKGADKMYALDGDEYRPKRIFSDGIMMNGSYGNTRITRTGADSFVVGDHDLVFSRDGKFSRGGSVSVSGGWYSILGGDTAKSGTYFVKDSAVHLNYANGEREVLPIWAEEPNDVIWFEGDMYKLPTQ